MGASSPRDDGPRGPVRRINWTLSRGLGRANDEVVPGGGGISTAVHDHARGGRLGSGAVTGAARRPGPACPWRYVPGSVLTRPFTPAASPTDGRQPRPRRRPADIAECVTSPAR